jgi:hypothetical protein
VSCRGTLAVAIVATAALGENLRFAIRAALGFLRPLHDTGHLSQQTALLAAAAGGPPQERRGHGWRAVRKAATPASMTRATPSRKRSRDRVTRTLRGLRPLRAGRGSAEKIRLLRRTTSRRVRTREPGGASGGRRAAKAAGGMDAPPAATKSRRAFATASCARAGRGTRSAPIHR